MRLVHQFDHRVVSFRLEGQDGIPCHPRRWLDSLSDNTPWFGGVSYLLGLLTEGSASTIDLAVSVPNALLAGGSAAIRNALGLPGLVPFTLYVDFVGSFSDPEARFEYYWRYKGIRLPSREHGIPVPERRGLSLTTGPKTLILQDPLYSVIEGIEVYNAQPPASIAERMAAWGRLRALIGDESGNLELRDTLFRMRVSVASSFSLAFGESFDQFHPVPIGTLPDSAPTLDAEPIRTQLTTAIHQDSFADQFSTYPDVRSAYAVGDDHFLIVDGSLRKALEVVKRFQSDPNTEHRRDFALRPHAYLVDALSSELDQNSIDQLFFDTAAYADRVERIGEYEKGSLPGRPDPIRSEWIPPGDDEDSIKTVYDGEIPVRFRTGEAQGLVQVIVKGIANGADEVTWPSPSGEQQLLRPTVRLLREIQSAVPGTPLYPDKEKEKNDQEAKQETTQRLIAKAHENIWSLLWRERARDRPKIPIDRLPGTLDTALKPHQMEGLKWLIDHWNANSPGALLADDMGLGKTLQVIVFLALIREEEERHAFTSRKPFIVIGPTTLLENWLQEIEKHLAYPRLGEQVAMVFGTKCRDYRATKRKELATGLPSLDLERLRQSSLILTSYETYRDYQHSLGRISCRVAVMDETQKAKNPQTLFFKAMETVNADFKVAITGTPVENALSDLWAVCDLVQPSVLDTLKEFRSRYKPSDAASLQELKAHLERPYTPQDWPPDWRPWPKPMMRRLKVHHLKGLPLRDLRPVRREMPERQAFEYSEVLKIARSRRGEKGQMLSAIQQLRSCSLLPQSVDLSRTEEVLAASARLQVVMEILDGVRDTDEKALVFLERNELHPWLAAYLQKRYQLPKKPFFMHGQVPVAKRLTAVNAFQERKGFDVMILSPKVGGVGLNLVAANHVIHLERWWNPAIEDQCNDRVFRIGQDKGVKVYLPLAVHPDSAEKSFDINLHNLIEHKRNLSADLLVPVHLDEGDVTELFNQSIGDDAEGPGDYLRSLTPIEFENWICQKLEGCGLAAFVTPHSGDKGADAIAVRGDGYSLIVQCKHTTTDRKIDDEIVKDLIRARVAGYPVHEPRLVGVTNAGAFTDRAIQLARENGVKLVAGPELAEWLESV